MQRNFKFDTPEWFTRPEFAYVAPQNYVGARGKPRSKNARANLVPDVLESFSDAALQIIHDQPRSIQAALAIFIFNFIAFDKELIGTSRCRANKLSYGQTVQKCLNAGYEREIISSTILTLLERNALKIKNNKLTCFPLIGLTSSYVEGYAQQYMDWKEAQSGLPANTYQQTVLRNPDFIKQDRYAIPEKKEGQLMWRRRQMPHDAVQALQRHELLRIHAEPESIEGKRAIQIFNVVAFGSHALKDAIDDPSFIKGNFITYSGLMKHICPLRNLSREQVDTNLIALLNSGVLHVQRGSRETEYFLTANKFLDDIAIIETEKEPVPPRDLYAELTEREGDDIRILTPVEFLIPEYQTPPPLIGSLVWSHAKVPGVYNVYEYFDDEALAQIHPEIDSSIGQLCLHLFNLVAFGGLYLEGFCATHLHYGNLVRIMFKEKVPFDTFTDALRGLFERNAITIRTSEGGSNQFMAYPLLATARLRREKLATATVESINLRNRYKRKHITLAEYEEQKASSKAQRMLINRPDGEFDIGNETHCVGWNNLPCENGDGGQPRAVIADSWQDHFSWKLVSSGRRRRCKMCRQCSNAHSASRSQNDFMFNCAARHFHASIGRPVWRSWLMKMLIDTDVCDLCGGNFVMQQTNHPWQPSFNLKYPARGLIISSEAEARDFGNIVHNACNMAQHLTDFSAFQTICEFVAHHAKPDVENERVPLILEQRHFDTVRGTGRDLHDLSPDQSREICRRTLFQRDLLTGITIGYGEDFAIDLSHPTLPGLLLPSMDRILCDDEHPNANDVSNFRVVLRFVNFLTKNYADKDAVVRDWLGWIVTKYRPTF
jgi:hypothetical protein